MTKTSNTKRCWSRRCARKGPLPDPSLFFNLVLLASLGGVCLGALLWAPLPLTLPSFEFVFMGGGGVEGTGFRHWTIWVRWGGHHLALPPSMVFQFVLSLLCFLFLWGEWVGLSTFRPHVT